MQTLTSLFGSLALFGIIASGLLMMFAPRAGKELLKNILIATALFVVGSMLLQVFLPGHMIQKAGSRENRSK